MKNRIFKNGKVFLMFLTVFSICAIAIGILLKPEQSTSFNDHTVFAEAGDGDVLDKPEDFTYAPLDENTVEITGLANVDICRESFEVSIPTTSPDGKKITRIGNSAFELDDMGGYDGGITKITLTETIESIGDYAFASTYVDDNDPVPYHLFTDIKIPDSVKSIGENAFYSCKNLTNVLFGTESQLQSIGAYAFAGRRIIIESGGTDRYEIITNNISTITIPKSVKTIEDHAFYLCENLTNVNFEPSSQLQTIGEYAFAGAVVFELEVDESREDYRIYSASTNKISSITIPKSVTTIGSSAFVLCPELTTVNFESESQLETIGSYAFAGTLYKSKVDYHNDYEENSVSTNKITSIDIPKNVKTIGDYAFYLCPKLSNVNFDTEAQLQSIGVFAFGGIREYLSYDDYDDSYDRTETIEEYQLTSFTVPKNVQSLSLNFLDDEKGNSIDWTISPDNTYLIGGKKEQYIYNQVSNTLLSCKLTDIPENVKSTVQAIGSYAFMNVDLSSTSIEIPTSVTTLEDYAFYNCGLTSFTFGTEIKTIGESAFASDSDDSYPTNITTLNYTGTLEDWLEIDFANGTANPLNYGASLKISGTSQTEITINKDVKNYAFYGCNGLTNVTINSPATSIGEQAFYKTTTTSITLGESITSIGSQAFGDNNYDTKSKIAAVTFTGSFDQWIDIDFADGYANPLCNGAPLTIGSELQTSITINKDLKQYAFYNCTSLNEVTIGVNVKSIGLSAFYSSSKHITSVTYNGTVEDWLEIDFANESANPLNKGADLMIEGQPLTSLKTAKNIKNYAFYGCTKLNDVTLDEGMSSIGSMAFYGTGVTMITIPESLTDYKDDTFLESGTWSYISYIIVKSKARYNEMKNKNVDFINNVTYQIRIVFNRPNSEQRTETKLYRKDLKWNLVDGAWTLGTTDFAWDDGDNWSDGENVFIRDLADFKSKWSNGKITDDVILNKVELVNEIVDTKTKFTATSQKGFFENAVELTVNEITDVEALKVKLGDLYFDGVVKMYADITFNQKDLAYANDVQYILNEEDVKDYYVWTYDYHYKSGSGYVYELVLQYPVDGKYNFGSTIPTIVLANKTGSGVVEEPTKKLEVVDNSGSFFAHYNEGFSDDVTLNAEKVSNVEQLQAKLGDTYKVKEAIEIQLKQGEGLYEGDNITLWFYENYVGNYDVFLLSGETLSAMTAGDGKFTIDGNSATIVLAEKVIAGTQDEPKKENNNALIIGLAVGDGVAALTIIGLVAWAIISRKRRFMM